MNGGVVVLDKEGGRSSAWLSRLVGHRAGFRKAGHLGTLDPMATGILVVLLGEATKFAAFATDFGKTYVATVRFGVTTDTDDMDGQVTSEATVPADLGTRVAELLPSFVGEIRQQIPFYSANKHEGRAFYSYSRVGESPPRRCKTVLVESIRIDDTAENRVTLEIATGPGVYVRSIARDLGEGVGCGATLAALRRTRVGHYTLDSAVPGADARAPGSGDLLRERILPADGLLKNMETVHLDGDTVDDLKRGLRVSPPATKDVPSPGRLAVYSKEGKFGGVCEISPEGLLRPVRMVSL